MSAMSYWLIESTAAELQRINEKIEDGPRHFFLDLNPSERTAYPELVEACRRFLDYHEEVISKMKLWGTYVDSLNAADSQEEE